MTEDYISSTTFLHNIGNVELLSQAQMPIISVVTKLQHSGTSHCKALQTALLFSKF